MMIPGIEIDDLKFRAWNKLNAALAAGKIPPAKHQTCAHCGVNREIAPGVTMHWHHTNYYEPLNVTALCALCHSHAHRGIDRIASPQNGTTKIAMLRVQMSKEKLTSLSDMAQKYGCNNISDYVRMTLDYFSQHQPPVVRLPQRDITAREQNEKVTA